MSVYSLQINFEKAKTPNDLLSNVNAIISESFSQNDESICGNLMEKINMSLKGSTEPMVFLTIQTIQDLNVKINQSCARSLSDYLSKALNITKERILIYFAEKVLSDVAFNGSLLIQNSNA